MGILLFILILLVIIFIAKGAIKGFEKIKPVKIPEGPFPKKWRSIIQERVSFYHQLSAEEKKIFEYKVHEFLLNCKITGLQTTVGDVEKVLVASGAIIPIMGFPKWRYPNIKNVLICEDHFNDQFILKGEGRKILGMVGSHFLENKMILSKKAIHHGFNNISDKKNTTVHEFVHLIDKADGAIDGIPKLLLEKEHLMPWMNLIQLKTQEIQQKKSDINPYGATERAEFFTVASEYFFERPHLLEKKHPKLYQMLEEIFDQDVAARKKVKLKKVEVKRNAPCPCGSGKKFKKCCAI